MSKFKKGDIVVKTDRSVKLEVMCAYTTAFFGKILESTNPDYQVNHFTRGFNCFYELLVEEPSIATGEEPSIATGEEPSIATGEDVETPQTTLETKSEKPKFKKGDIVQHLYFNIIVEVIENIDSLRFSGKILESAHPWFKVDDAPQCTYASFELYNGKRKISDGGKIEIVFGGGAGGGKSWLGREWMLHHHCYTAAASEANKIAELTKQLELKEKEIEDLKNLQRQEGYYLAQHMNTLHIIFFNKDKFYFTSNSKGYVAKKFDWISDTPLDLAALRQTTIINKSEEENK